MIRKRMTAIIMSLAVSVAAFGGTQMPAQAAVGYLDHVTAKMSEPSFWTEKMRYPDRILANADEIDAVNRLILDADGTNVTDLSVWTQTTFNGVAMAQSLKAAAESDAVYLYGQGSRYDQDGVLHVADGEKGITKEQAVEAVYGEMIENCFDKDATESMPVQYGIITTRTTIRCFPSFGHLYDNPADPDFDNLYQTGLRVNEPVIVRARSNDRQFYHVVSECSSGWVPAEDIAICSNKEEWLDAWKFEAKDTLVVYADRITTETSNFAPEVSKRALSMGTTLELADPSEWTDLIINRTAHNNHVVWMPVRRADGTYEKKQALISEHCQVSEGFLPLTSANLAKVALNFLGNCYGWGGMLDSEDCSGYVRDVYRCFGINLARNTSWQAKQPVKKYTWTATAASESDEKKEAARREKTAVIEKLPVGSVLIFSGHEMIYLGRDGDNLYVISAVSNMRPESAEKVVRIRNTVINTLNVLRANGQTWLDALTTAEVPYLTSDAGDDFGVRSPEETAVDQLKAAEEEIKKQEQQIQNAKEEIARQKQALADANQQIGQQKEQIGQQKEQIAESASRLEQQEEKIAESENQLAQQKQQIEKASQQLVQQEEQLNTVKAQLTEAQKQVAKSDQGQADAKQIAAIQAQLSDLGKTIQSYQKEIKALSAKKSRVPAKAVIKSVKGKKKALKIAWKKQKGVSGYRIVIASDKKFTKNVKRIRINKASLTSKTVEKLKSKKTWYVRIRAYKKVKGGVLTGEWSKIRKAKTK